jgi:excisionase family DNA binding protein
MLLKHPIRIGEAATSSPGACWELPSKHKPKRDFHNAGHGLSWEHLRRAAEPGCRKVMGMSEIREVMNMGAASEYLGVSKEALYKYVPEKKIPAFKIGNRWRFKKAMMDNWMESESEQFEHRGSRRLRAAARGREPCQCFGQESNRLPSPPA